MKILAIETSCDETAVAIVEAEGEFEAPKFKVLATNLYSQASKHAEFGGVYPNLAKREHSRNLIPLLKKTLEESGFGKSKSEITKSKQSLNPKLEKTKEILERNPELLEHFKESISPLEVPDIDAIAVTEGPGLEPALWVGITFAQALGEIWDKPVFGTNHMEGHIYSVLLDEILAESDKNQTQKMEFPSLALLISGGHTELVLVKSWRDFEILGQTRDDAVGEAFDKTARVLDLPYPGGPEISKLAQEARKKDMKLDTEMPRPMIKSEDLDFSFSGLKTAVLYYEKEHGPLNKVEKMKLAREIEDAICEVLLSKTKKALSRFNVKSLVIGGGVIANPHLRKLFQKLINEDFPDVKLLIPTRELSTDNAVMIGIASYFKILSESPPEKIGANGNLKLS